MARFCVDGDTRHAKARPEGATVTVLAREGDELFEVSSELENALLQAIDEAQRGDAVSGENLLTRLRNRA